MLDRAANTVELRQLTIGDKTVSLSVDTAHPEEPAFFVLGVRKSGSTMLNKAVTFLASRSKHHCVDWPGMFFKNGFTVRDWSGLDFSNVIEGGNVYTGFRNFPKALAGNAAFAKARKVLLVRDPRDALVSQYYSDAFSHALPSAKGMNAEQGRQSFIEKRKQAQESDINDYVIAKAAGMNTTLMEYKDIVGDETTLLLKYEHVIFQKRWMLGKILKHYGWTLHPGKIDNLMKQIHVIPSQEDEKKFVRKAIPGDHLEKLKPETIRKLNAKLAKSLSFFDYE